MGGARYTQALPSTHHRSSVNRRSVHLHRSLDARPGSRAAVDCETASGGSSALPHLEQAERVTGQRGVDIEAATVVFDADGDLARVPRDADDRVASVGMESHIVERFPHDAIEVPLELGLAPRA